MIELIIGTNAYAVQQRLTAIEQETSLEPERIDVDELTLNGLADIMRGASLFIERRLVILRQLSERKDLWDKLGEWANVLPSKTTLVLIEPKPDKRTKTYKILQKAAKITTAEPLTERKRPMAERWLMQYAAAHKVSLTRVQAGDMVGRALVPDDSGRSLMVDQLQLAHAVAALTHANQVTDQAIAAVLPPAREFSVFALVELAVRRQAKQLQSALNELQLTDDPHKLAPLIWTQWSQLVAIAFYDSTNDAAIAQELALHPFVVKKMQPLARQIHIDDLRQFTQQAARLDVAAKTGDIPPWDAINDFLFAIVLRAAN